MLKASKVLTIAELALKSRDEDRSGRLKIITGAGFRREWPPEGKVRIVVENYEADEAVRAMTGRR